MRKTVTTVELIDDMSGDTADETVEFGFAGKYFEIDLSTEAANDFEAMMRPYMRAGRPLASAATGKRVKGVKKTDKNGDSAAIRRWAKANGYEVGLKGRVPREIVMAYDNRNN